jgi:hypothetical protein
VEIPLWFRRVNRACALLQAHLDSPPDSPRQCLPCIHRGNPHHNQLPVPLSAHRVNPPCSQLCSPHGAQRRVRPRSPLQNQVDSPLVNLPVNHLMHLVDSLRQCRRGSPVHSRLQSLLSRLQRLRPAIHPPSPHLAQADILAGSPQVNRARNRLGNLRRPLRASR